MKEIYVLTWMMKTKKENKREQKKIKKEKCNNFGNNNQTEQLRKYKNKGKKVMCDNLNVENKRTFEKKKKDNRRKNGELDILGDVKKPKKQ